MTNAKYPKLQDKRIFVLLPKHQETPQGGSCTVPDQALTIREIMAKHVRGMRIADELEKQPLYNLDETRGDTDFDSPDLEALGRMDMSERSEYLAELREHNELRKADINAAIKAHNERLQAEADEAEAKKDQGNDQGPNNGEPKGERAKRREPKVSPQKDPGS